MTTVPEPAGDDVLKSGEARGKVVRGSALRIGANIAGLVLGLITATLLLRHLGVEDSGRYVTVLSLVGIAVSIVDTGLNVGASRDLTVRDRAARRVLLANVIAQRILVAAVALVLLVAFALAAGYPESMVAGTAMAGFGVLIVAVANAYLLPLIVDLRNTGIAMVETLRAAVTMVGVALLVWAGSELTPFFAVQIGVGLVVLAVVPFLIGREWLVRPRFQREEQRSLMRTALPIAAALALGQIYFRLVIVLMSLISNPEQTGYFGGSLRAVEALAVLPVLVAGVALPLMSSAAKENLPRLRRAIEGLGEGAVIAGVLVILFTFRAAEPVMHAIGGSEFEPAGDVLRIQVGALLFIALYQIWTVALVALERQRQLIFTNALGLLAVGIFAGALVPPLGAKGGAIASVLADAVLAALIYWRLHVSTGRVTVKADFLLRVALAAAAGAAFLFIPGLPDLVAATLAAVVFLGVGQLIGMVPSELHEALGPKGLLRRGRGQAPPV